MTSGFRVMLLALIALVAMGSVSLGQTNYFFRPVTLPTGAPPLPAPAGLDGNWYTEADGDPNTTGGTNWYDANGQNFIPAFDFGNGERAFIENGGTAIVNSSGTYQPGQIVMGSAGNTSGTLEIQSGGTIASRIGTAVNGNITVGSAGGIGTLRVLPGGTITGEGSLAQGTNTSNLIRVGGLTGAIATLTAASAVMPSKVQVFPNAAFSVTGTSNFSNTTVYTSEITGNGLNGKINIGATATLGGSLALNFNGYTPSVGHNWNVLEATAYSNNFSSVTSNATLASNQAFVVSKPSVGGGQTAYNVSVQEVLVLEVNRDNGEARLRHPGGANIQLDGYFIGSTAGSLKPGSWSSWDAGNLFGGDWLATAATANNLGELKPVGDATLNGGNTLNYNFGSVYDPYAGAFGTVSEDLVFGYRRSDGTQFPGRVVYSGTKFNTLMLQVDPTGTGDAFLKNTSDTTVEIDAYDIRSTAGRLAPGTAASLDGAANAWISVNSTANLLGEVNQSGWTTLAPGASFNLGKLYLGGTQDLQLAFLLKGQASPTPGQVHYLAATGGVQGDYNNNGIVDAADYTLWRNNLGQPAGALQNRNPLNSGNINQTDYTYWKQRFGATSGSGSIGTSQVPEPSAYLLLVVGLGLLTATRRGER